jgi:hypothetical protein
LEEEQDEESLKREGGAGEGRQKVGVKLEKMDVQRRRQ